MSAPRGAVVAVHGRTQDPEFIRGVVDRLAIGSSLTVIAPAAEGRSWYPKPFLAPMEENQPFLDAALDRVDACVEEALAAGVPLERIVLLGFSQGACLLTHSALTRPRRYAAVIAFTGGFIGPIGTSIPRPAGLEGMPFAFATHTDDPWVPLSRTLESIAVAGSAGASARLLVEPGGVHEVTDAAIRLADEVLAPLFP
ncbi:phospholipase [Herbiconiux sp.]|uniref:alpha/beta hydrolase n=1 Tax=Herbiconiux sp. TaxID=1871186 RepID=UPI0025BBA8E0|nr:phospholipase [Herbiconiux sp.]